MAQGTNLAVVRAYVDELEARVRAALPPGQVDMISTEIRGDDAEVELRLAPRDQRTMSGAEVADRLRAAVGGKIPGGEIQVDAQPGLWILRRIFSSGEGRGRDRDRAAWLGPRSRRPDRRPDARRACSRSRA